MREILQFQPLYQERVWGGRRLESALGRTLPPGPPIGESWEIVDRADAQSVIRGGSYNGTTLRRVIEKHAEAVMGPGWDPSRPFPILVKWLDCSERLSLQVHPPREVAGSLGGEPKTENWYVAHSAPGAALFVGLKKGVTREAFAEALAQGTAETLVSRVPVAAGDSVLVQSGQVHAIDAGNLILEIQQNSDTTYRLYDWGRVGLDGKPRKLHVEESMRSILWDAGPPELVRAAPTSSVIASCDEFQIRRVVLGRGEALRFSAREKARILSVAAGAVTLEGSGRTVGLGENALVPYSVEAAFTAADHAIVLVTENFS
jgi:mannose-6-phosphate isomerase